MLDGRKLHPELLEEFRVRAIKKILDGESPEVVARFFGFSAKSIYTWINQYKDGGWESLRVVGQKGRPASLGASELARLKGEFEGRDVTVKEIVKVCGEKLGVEVSAGTAYRVAKKLGITVVAKAPRRNGRIKPIIRLIGSKHRIAPWIVSFFPKHSTYIEPFCGTCSVLFAKAPSPIEIINDQNKRLVNVYKMVTKNLDELERQVRCIPYAEANFYDVPKDAIEDASLFMATTMQRYTGRDSGHFAISKNLKGEPWKLRAFVWSEWYRRLKPASERLKGVQIICRDAVDVINRFADNPDSLLYVDPPYFGFESYYGEKVDYEAMVEALHRFKGKVIISEYEGALKFFKYWNTATRAVKNHNGKGRTEYLFMNF